MIINQAAIVVGLGRLYRTCKVSIATKPAESDTADADEDNPTCVHLAGRVSNISPGEIEIEIDDDFEIT